MSEMILYTTLNELKKHSPCTDGYRKLLKHIGMDYHVDQPIDLLTILQSNGFDDAVWSLRAAMPVADRDRIARLFACDCAESVLHLFEAKYPDDHRPRRAIETARLYAVGKATEDELKASASASAYAAASAYAYAAASAYASAAWSAYAAASAYASASAAWSAYASAAWSASASAADDERKKQTETLKNYLRGAK